MTYGWAILIIAIVMVALFQLGVFNGTFFAPRATAGACEVYRSVEGINLVGQCQGELPQFVAQFNGNGYIHGSTNNVGAAIAQTEIGTISFWININSWPTSWSELVDTQSNNLFFVHTDNSDRIFVCDTPQSVSYPGGYVNCPIIYSGIALGQWVLITATMGLNPGYTLNYLNSGYSTSANMALYVNGALVSNVITSPTYDGVPSPFQINSGGQYWGGSLANAQIYNTSLSANEVNALYLEGIGGAPVDPTHIVGWWPLNGNAQDYSGNNNGGVPTNVVYTSSWTSGYTQP